MIKWLQLSNDNSILSLSVGNGADYVQKVKIMLSKQDAIDAAKDRNHMIDESRMIYFKPVDYSDNPIAPEQTAYRLYYWDIFGKRQKFTFWPNSVGFQGMR